MIISQPSMNSFYYFSKTRLKLVEIKSFPKKFLALFVSMVLLVSSLLFGSYFLIRALWSSGSEVSSLENENKELTGKVKELIKLYGKLNNQVDSLSKANNDLRLAADLPPVDQVDRKFGTGGGVFDNYFNFSKHSSKLNFDELTNFVDAVQNKIAFEKTNYFEISSKLKNNRLLYESIPAIKPAAGVVTEHGFGMRLHPILNIVRMHDGIDIVAEVGTPVVAPGRGVISFVGEKGGYGLCIEIDHGFGYRTVYGHLSVADVKVGQNIKRGEMIGRTGNTGLSTGPHLHYEVHHDGIALDPAGFMFDDLELFELSAKNKTSEGV
ncbi:MAG: M23 family metallopeptidase [Clostridiales bacterium]